MAQENKMNQKSGIFKRFLDPDTKIVKHAKWYAIAPLAIISVGLIVVLFFNFNLGLDFTGGRIVTISGFTNYSQTQKIVESEMVKSGIKGAHFQEEEKTTGGIVMTVKFPEPEGLDVNDSDKVDAFFAKLQESINEKLLEGGYATIQISPSDSLSASASNEKIYNVFMAVGLALIVILIYMLVRFKFNSGVSSVVALFHDVLVMAAMVAIFRIQVNFVFVAAAITVVAYSLNNTLVLFDRIRDKEKDLESRLTTEQVVDISIKETFGRTLATTITTIVPVAVLAILGVPLIREFALPIIFGLVAGTFSTIFVATSLYVRFENARKIRAKKRKA